MQHATKFLLLIILALVSANLFCQSPVLVQDLYVGEEDGFYQFNHKGIVFNDKLIIPANDGTSGVELFLVENGSLSLLKDLVPGEMASNPHDFTIYNERVYFIASDSLNRREVWVTDGTAEGTELFFSIPTPPQDYVAPSLLVSPNNVLYFSLEGDLYASDGMPENTFLVEGIEGDVSLAINFDTKVNQACNYGLGIAITTIDDPINEHWIYVVNEGIAENIWNMSLPNSTEVIGLNEVEAGLFFAINTASWGLDFREVLVYNKTTEAIDTLRKENNEAFPVRRLLDVNPQKAIFATSGPEGSNYVITDGTQAGTQLLHSGYGISQFDEFYYAIVGDKMIYGAGDIYDDNDFIKYYITDGSFENTNLIGERDVRFSSEMIIHQDLVYWADGISNGDEPSIWSGNFAEESTEIIYNFTASSAEKPAVSLQGIINNQLYFTCNLFGLGRELYSMPLSGAGTNIASVKNTPHQLLTVNNNDTYLLKSENTMPFELKVVNIQGQVVEQLTTSSNNTFSVNLPPNNIYLFVFKEQKGATTFTFTISN